MFIGYPIGNIERGSAQPSLYYIKLQFSLLQDWNMGNVLSGPFLSLSLGKLAALWCLVDSNLYPLYCNDCDGVDSGQSLHSG